MVYIARIHPGIVKIGFTTNLKNRLNGIRGDYYGGKRIYGIAVLRTIEGGRELEEVFHQHLRAYRMNERELFRYCKEMLTYEPYLL